MVRPAPQARGSLDTGGAQEPLNRPCRPAPTRCKAQTHREASLLPRPLLSPQLALHARAHT